MPAIEGQKLITEGLELYPTAPIFSKLIRFQKSDIPQSTFNGTISQIESYVNNWLDTKTSFTDGNGVKKYYFRCVVHVFTKTPLVFSVWTGDSGESLPTGNWWD